MTDDILEVVLDWDYDTFDIDDKGRYLLYELSLDYDKLPELVYISGYPWPGKKLERTLAKLVDPDKGAYELIVEKG